MEIIKLKKGIATFLVTALLATGSAASVSAQTYNNKDQPFSFTLPGTNYYHVDIQNGQRKENDTGSYIYSYSSNPSEGALFSIHGGHSKSVSSVKDLTNCTKGGSARIWPGQKRRIRQYVYELNYPYAFIGGSAITDAGANKNLSGLWSADSVGSDPYCN